ncbi:hypothetical protein EDE04_6401 [Streptomyces sp. 2132.2]|uniref:hypothetical protein n=1 Tax=Streptomyces TaxID=1883 RepID=UPI000F486F73|nr:hypothetical protein [Streptomyces sp. 2132.2]ROQ99843.1 hypothetical protein EDE04_6401 [Streptomyces sp. 2132.2]
MEDQGGAGGVPLHGHDDKERRRAPHAERTGTGKSGTGRTDRTRADKAGADKDAHAVRAADTDEASRLDRVGGSPKKGPGPVREIPHT